MIITSKIPLRIRPVPMPFINPFPVLGTCPQHSFLLGSSLPVCPCDTATDCGGAHGCFSVTVRWPLWGVQRGCPVSVTTSPLPPQPLTRWHESLLNGQPGEAVVQPLLGKHHRSVIAAWKLELGRARGLCCTWTLDRVPSDPSVWTRLCRGDVIMRLCLHKVCCERPAAGGRVQSFNTRNTVLFFQNKWSAFILWMPSCVNEQFAFSPWLLKVCRQICGLSVVCVSLSVGCVLSYPHLCYFISLFFAFFFIFV